MRKMLLALLVSLTVLTGCNTIKLHPVTDQDIKQVDGWICMTSDYVKEVMKARLDN